MPLEKAKKRIGTFCHKCHKDLSACSHDEYIEVPTKGYGEKRYVCKQCAHNDVRGFHGWESYGDEVNGITGKETKSKLQIAVEWEGHFYNHPVTIGETVIEDSTQVKAYLASQYQLLPTHDSTVDCEFKEMRRASLHGVKERIRGIAEVLDMTRYGSGHHINISKTTWHYEEYIKLHEYSEQLFSPLAYYMNDNEDETRRVFGRCFTDFCAFTSYNFVHGSWLNIRGNDSRDNKNEPCLEFRLAKFHDVDQFFYLMNFCKEVVETVDIFLHSEYENIETASTLIGDEIVLIFRKYANGKALCMRPERNSRRGA